MTDIRWLTRQPVDTVWQRINQHIFSSIFLNIIKHINKHKNKIEQNKKGHTYTYQSYPHYSLSNCKTDHETVTNE